MLPSRFPTWVITPQPGNPGGTRVEPGANRVSKTLHKKWVQPIDKQDLIRYIIYRTNNKGVHYVSKGTRSNKV